MKKGVVVIEGDMPPLERVTTHLHSLDRLMIMLNGKDPGMPVRTGIELYGSPESGKSTLAYYLSGCVKPSGKITLIDLEGGGRKEYVASAVGQSGFSGTVRRVDFVNEKGERRTHEEMLKVGANSLLDDDVNAVILDSAAATMPILEREGDMEEQFVGRRAQVLARWARRWMAWLSTEKDPKLVIIVNHMLQPIMGFGVITPGGATMKFGCSVRLHISREETFEDGSFEALIYLAKLRFGGKPPKRKDRYGRAIIIPGLGVSPEMTMAFDLMDLGAANRTGGYVNILEGENKTRVAKLLTLLKWAREGKTEKFEPFREKMEEINAGAE
jgi:RecA/RadA recombinase